MLRFHIFGIQVTVEPWFWLSMALIGGGMSTDSKSEFVLLLLFLMAGFFSILVHELGHAIALKKFNVPSSIVLHAFGGYTTHPPGSLSRTQTFVMVLGGPVLQFFLAGVAFLVISYIPLFQESKVLYFFIITLFNVSWFWAVINLLPVLPLDGGQLLGTLLGPKHVKLTYTLSIFASISCAAWMFFKFQSPYFSIFLLFMGYQSFQTLKATRLP